MNARSSRPAILIIEDDPALRRLLIESFLENAMDAEGYGSGKEGFERLTLRSFDLVLLDIGLPDTNGYDLFRKIRALMHVPVLFMTQRTDSVDHVTCLEMGAVDFVQKPLEEAILMARVRKALRETEARRLDPKTLALRIEGHFRLDSEQRSVHYLGQRLPLTRIEFAILECMLQRPNQVFSRAQLLDRAWPEKVGSMDRTIDTHIRSIRAKLRQVDPERKLIQTHHGLGYALVPH